MTHISQQNTRNIFYQAFCFMFAISRAQGIQKPASHVPSDDPSGPLFISRDDLFRVISHPHPPPNLPLAVTNFLVMLFELAGEGIQPPGKPPRCLKLELLELEEVGPPPSPHHGIVAPRSIPPKNRFPLFPGEFCFMSFLSFKRRCVIGGMITSLTQTLTSLPLYCCMARQMKFLFGTQTVALIHPIYKQPVHVSKIYNVVCG